MGFVVFWQLDSGLGHLARIQKSDGAIRASVCFPAQAPDGAHPVRDGIKLDRLAVSQLVLFGAL